MRQNGEVPLGNKHKAPLQDIVKIAASVPRCADTRPNVYISALQFGGKPMQLLDMAINGEIEIAVSQPIITEVGRVLEKKFHWP